MDEYYNDRLGNTSNDNNKDTANTIICWNDNVVHHCNNYDDNINNKNGNIVDTIGITLSSKQQRKHVMDDDDFKNKQKRKYSSTKVKVQKPFLKFLIAKRAAARSIQDFYNIKDLCFHSFTKSDMYFVLSQYYSLQAISLLQDEEFRNNHNNNNKNYDRQHGLGDAKKDKCQLTNNDKHNSHDAVQLLLVFANFYSHLLEKQQAVYTDSKERQQHQDDEYVTTNLESIVDCTKKQQQQNYENDETKINLNCCTKDNNNNNDTKLFLSNNDNDLFYCNNDDNDAIDIIVKNDDICSRLEESEVPNYNVVCDSFSSIVNNKNKDEYSIPTTSTINRIQDNNQQEQQSYNENLQQNVSNLTDESDTTNHVNDDYNNESCQNTSTVEAAAATATLHLISPQSPYDESLNKVDIDYDYDFVTTDVIDFSILENGFLELQLELQNFNNLIINNKNNTIIGTISSVIEEATIIDNTISSIPANITQCTTSTLLSDTISCVTSQFDKSLPQNPSPRSLKVDCNNNNNITTSDISINLLNQKHSDNLVPKTKCDVTYTNSINQQQEHIGSQSVGNATVADTGTSDGASTTNTIDQFELFDNLQDDMEEEEWAMECKLLKDSIANDIDELDSIIQKCFDSYSIS